MINPESAAKERTVLTRSAVLAIRELMRQTEADTQTKDLAAFIALALEGISATIDSSVEAWEKRGYWVKADRFRMEWLWSENLGRAMRQAVLADDLPGVAATAVQIAAKLSKVKVPQRHGLGTPWVGAFERLRANGANGRG